MSNGTHVAAVDLVRHGAYQAELVRLMRSLTRETADGRVVAAMTDAQAFDAIVKFRRAHGLVLLDCDPLYYVIALHRARIRHKAMTPAEVNWSEHWLIRQDKGTDVDTEFNPKPEARR
jgi:hypothetical protein